MSRRIAASLAALVLGSTLVACGGSPPSQEPEQAPPAETEASSDSAPPIFEEGFEAGDEQEWSESVVAPDDEDDEPEVP
jgi:hypothetical protein